MTFPRREWLQANPALATHLNPIAVLEVSQQLTERQAERLKEAFTARTNMRAIVLTGGIHLAAILPGDAAEHDTPIYDQLVAERGTP